MKVGNDKASSVYVRNKIKQAEYVGIKSILKEYENISEDDLLKEIELLNNDKNVSGILVQLPLPKNISEEKITNAISFRKDVDGFHPMNVGKLYLGEKTIQPCTPKGIIALLDEYNINISGKNVVVIGRSNIVGKPVGQLMLSKNATVTYVHSKTKNIKEVTNKADILIVAIGRANFIDRDFIKEGAVVVDVGINRDENNKLCGDVDFESVKGKVAAISPVPGGAAS